MRSSFSRSSVASDLVAAKPIWNLHRLFDTFRNKLGTRTDQMCLTKRPVCSNFKYKLIRTSKLLELLMIKNKIKNIKYLKLKYFKIFVKFSSET